MGMVWYVVFRRTGSTWVEFFLSKIILRCMGAFIAYEVLYLMSLGSFRQRWYELFLGSHVTIQVLALIFLWFYHHGSGPYVYGALAKFLVDRVSIAWL